MEIGDYVIIRGNRLYGEIVGIFNSNAFKVKIPYLEMILVYQKSELSLLTDCSKIHETKLDLAGNNTWK